MNIQGVYNLLRLEWNYPNVFHGDPKGISQWFDNKTEKKLQDVNLALGLNDVKHKFKLWFPDYKTIYLTITFSDGESYEIFRTNNSYQMYKLVLLMHNSLLFQLVKISELSE